MCVKEGELDSWSTHKDRARRVVIQAAAANAAAAAERRRNAEKKKTRSRRFRPFHPYNRHLFSFTPQS
jgi:hypothetical protein